MDKSWIAEVVMWIGSSVTIGVATEITRSSWCLLAFLIPAFVSISRKNKSK